MLDIYDFKCNQDNLLNLFTDFFDDTNLSDIQGSNNKNFAGSWYKSLQ